MEAKVQKFMVSLEPFKGTSEYKNLNKGLQGNLEKVAIDRNRER